MIPQDKRAEEIKDRWQRWFDARSDWDAQAKEEQRNCFALVVV